MERAEDKYSEVIEHIPNWKFLVKESKRCLKEGHTEPQLAKTIGYSNLNEIDQLAEGMAHAYLDFERR